ncbi:hypothetical protein KD050_06550 [Psychrobacillus sp. INOP01]|uniref:hypothetical protein n=1 Tax=Psychrobacillus sp. INOP01 TaxID=2829187 RepID=UPI001BA4D758|nr:hypothetical protein [Psychrobacillus sp. INOP01]QUG42902.1 hypothetical protein KD050_06550 [Psychrobacillus sp. INOP01]
MKLFKKTGRSMAVLVMLSVILLGACSEETTPKETTSTGEQLAKIINYELSTRTLTLDEVEWIEESDTDRIKELGLDVEKDLPTGFVIYNETNEESSIKLAEDAEFLLVNQENPSEPRAVDEKEFISYLLAVKGPYYVTVKDEVVVKIEEKYVP